MCFRYKIYIEGWAWSVSEKYIFACDSPVLLMTLRWYDFFTRGMVPQHHYWPVRDSDKCRSLKFAVEWGNNHTEKVKKKKRFFTPFLHKPRLRKQWKIVRNLFLLGKIHRWSWESLHPWRFKDGVRLRLHVSSFERIREAVEVQAQGPSWCGGALPRITGVLCSRRVETIHGGFAGDGASWIGSVHFATTLRASRNQSFQGREGEED